MKKRSVKTNKKQTTAEEQMYNATLTFSNAMNNLCDNIILVYDELLGFTKVNKNKRAMHVLNYMSCRMHIIRSLKKRLCKLYTITDHKDFIVEFNNIYLRYDEKMESFRQVLECIEYIFTDNETKVVISSYNLAPLQCCLVGTDLQNNKSAYSLDLIKSVLKKWKG